MPKLALPEKTSWETIAGSGLPAVIYGMGNGADRVIDEFNRLGIAVKGVCASDDFVRGQRFRGFTVKRLSEFTGDFILCIAFGTHRPEVINHILKVKEQYRTIVPVVPVYGDEIFNRDFVCEHIDALNSAYSLFTGKSAEIFSQCVNFMYSGDIDILVSSSSSKDEAYGSILKLTENEHFLDIGAYKGDTVAEFIHYCGGKYSCITAAEPDPKSFASLIKNCAELERFTAVNAAVSDRCGTVSFAAKGGRQSSVSGAGREIRSLTADEICKNKTVTYIKIDVEGEERAVLRGAAQTVAAQKPKLNIALYHKSRDIFEIPLLVKQIRPDYRFEIRHHPYIPCWDMNLYCV